MIKGIIPVRDEIDPGTKYDYDYRNSNDLIDHNDWCQVLPSTLRYTSITLVSKDEKILMRFKSEISEDIYDITDASKRFNHVGRYGSAKTCLGHFDVTMLSVVISNLMRRKYASYIEELLKFYGVKKSKMALIVRTNAQYLSNMKSKPESVSLFIYYNIFAYFSNNYDVEQYDSTFIKAKHQKKEM